MKKREFKSESKRLLDLMINSIYTNKEIFLRELISNASDAIDKLYFKSLTDDQVKLKKEDFKIDICLDEKERTLTISDNGIGMTEEELENNLGTIAKSGSFTFKQENPEQNDVDIIGQFGVGFYSCFMVSDKVTVHTKTWNGEGIIWESTGLDGYTIHKKEKEKVGTTITLHLKDNTEDEIYSDYLTEYKIRSLVSKYSDYIKYPIMMEVENRKLKEGTDSEYETVKEITTLNSMIPIWKKSKKDISEDEYHNFYSDKFYDYEKPLHIIHYSVEGTCSFKALLYIPSHAPYDFYTKEYEKGLQLYSNGVLIMDKCSDLLPDYFSFVRGVVDSEDLSLNISREMLQKDRNVQIIAKNIESKIKSELEKMMKEKFKEYQTFFKAFGTQIKFGVYNNYGMDKDKLKDLLIFYSSTKKDYVTLKDYVQSLAKEEDKIYYACGETIDKIDLLPQVELVKDKNYDILYLTDYVDEFAIQSLREYEKHAFVNVSDGQLDLDTKEDKETLEKLNKESQDLLDFMKKTLENHVTAIRFTHRLKKHPVCLTTEGGISSQMEKVINAMPTEEKIKAQTILEINEHHPIANKVKELYEKDKDALEKYTKVLYAQARLIEGMTIDNPTEISSLVCELISEK